MDSEDLVQVQENILLPEEASEVNEVSLLQKNFPHFIICYEQHKENHKQKLQKYFSNLTNEEFESFLLEILKILTNNLTIISDHQLKSYANDWNIMDKDVKDAVENKYFSERGSLYLLFDWTIARFAKYDLPVAGKLFLLSVVFLSIFYFFYILLSFISNSLFARIWRYREKTFWKTFDVHRLPCWII